MNSPLILNDKFLSLIIACVIILGTSINLSHEEEETLGRHPRQTAMTAAPGHSGRETMGPVEDKPQIPTPGQPQSTRGWIDFNTGTYTSNYWPNWRNMSPPNWSPPNFQTWFSRFNQPGRDYPMVTRFRNMVGLNNNNNNNNNASIHAPEGAMAMNGMESGGMMNRMNWGANNMNRMNQNGWQRDSWYTPGGMMNSWNNMMIPNINNNSNSSLVKVFRGMMTPNNIMTSSGVSPSPLSPVTTASESTTTAGTNDMMNNNGAGGTMMTTTTTMSSVA